MEDLPPSFETWDRFATDIATIARTHNPLSLAGSVQWISLASCRFMWLHLLVFLWGSQAEISLSAATIAVALIACICDPRERPSHRR